MTQEQIIEGNKAIAEFMGWRFIKWCGQEYEDKIPMYQRFENNELVHPGIFHLPQFQDTWNILMPVVEKIEALDQVSCMDCRVKLERKYCAIYYDMGIESYEFSKTGISKIDAVWQSVVSFITWYNEQK